MEIVVQFSEYMTGEYLLARMKESLRAGVRILVRVSGGSKCLALSVTLVLEQTGFMLLSHRSYIVLTLTAERISGVRSWKDLAIMSW